MNNIPLEEIFRASLPPELINDDFIYGYPASYEEYLTDFINNSPLFLSLSDGNEYRHCPKDKQSNSECDCKSLAYELDFKLLGTQSSLYATRNLSPTKFYIENENRIFTMFPRQHKGMVANRLFPLLMRYNLKELIEIDQSPAIKFDRENLSDKSDLKAILKAVKCKKNTLFYLKDFIFSQKDYPWADLLTNVEAFLNSRLATLFEFRQRNVAECDTFLGAIIQSNFCIAKWDKEKLSFCDVIPISCSSRFTKLYGMVSDGFKEYLKNN